VVLIRGIRYVGSSVTKWLRFFYLVIGLLLLTSISRAEDSCVGLFVNKDLLRVHARIERLNRTELLRDVILIQRSSLLEAIQKNSFIRVWSLVENQRLQGLKSGYFDEINIATALGYNEIALFLYNNSSIDFRRIPLREDLLMTAIYFDNIEMLTVLMLQKNLTLSRSAKDRVLNWFPEHQKNRVRRAMLLNERIQSRQL
jgi:hypothetical protein